MNTPDVKHLPLKIIHDLAHSADIQPAVYRQQVTDTPSRPAGARLWRRGNERFYPA